MGGDGGETVRINGVVIHRKEFYFLFHFSCALHHSVQFNTERSISGGAICCLKPEAGQNK